MYSDSKPARKSSTMSDLEIIDDAVAKASKMSLKCTAADEAAIRAFPIALLRTLYDREIMLLPGYDMDEKYAAVWYECDCVIWNAALKGAIDVLAKQIDAMAQQGDFPKAILIWDMAGTSLQNQVAPSRNKFTGRRGYFY